MPEHEVIIAGGGPTGLMLAGELALAGVDVTIVELRSNQAVEGSRASGLHPRAIELLDQRGIAERFIVQGQKHQVVPVAGAMLDASDRPTRHSYTLALWQEPIERGLAEWAAELGVRVYRGNAVVGFRQDDTQVAIEITDATVLRGRYLVGCDGGRSLVRKLAEIGFSGWDPTVSYLIYEARMAKAPPLGMRYGPRGVYALGKLDDGRRLRGVIVEQSLNRGAASEDDLRTALVAAYGEEFGVHDISWLSRFTDAALQAATYRAGRVLVAGDAAHVHSPVGGQGLNLGLQDAVNLGWKLAQVVKQTSPDSLLDTYQDEQHPVALALLKQTLALTALSRGDDRTNELRSFVADALRQDDARRWYIAAMSGLNVRYCSDDSHPLVGRRMPDLDIETAEGNTRVFALLHEARPVLLNFSAAVLPDATTLRRVKRVDARSKGQCELPVVGPVPLPNAVLIRPDGHVAWAGEGDSVDLHKAMHQWFGEDG